MPFGELLPRKVLSCQMLLPERWLIHHGGLSKKRCCYKPEQHRMPRIGPAFCAMTFGSRILTSNYVWRHIFHRRAINPATDGHTCALNGIVLDEPKFVGAVIGKISP